MPSLMHCSQSEPQIPISVAHRRNSQHLQGSAGHTQQPTDQKARIRNGSHRQVRNHVRGEPHSQGSMCRSSNVPSQKFSVGSLLRGCSRTLRETSETLKRQQEERLRMQGLSREDVLSQVRSRSGSLEVLQTGHTLFPAICWSECTSTSTNSDIVSL